MSEEEKDVIDFLRVSAITKIEKTIISREDVKHLLNYIDKLQKELKDSINARFELQRRIDKTQKENAELKEEIKDLIEENHKHIDYIANMKKKHEDKIRTKIKELEENVKEFEEYWEKDPRKFKKEVCVDYYKLEVLKELLGDDE